MKNHFGTPYFVTATGATASYAIQTGVANTTVYITDIAASSDVTGAALVVKDGTTNIWQVNLGPNSAYQEKFETPLGCTSGNSATVQITGTSACTSNIAGFTRTK